MTPGQHFIVSWLVANAEPLDRRSRILITLSGLLPDLDGLGYLVDRLARLAGRATSYYEEYHHQLGHNLWFSLVLAFACARACRRRRTVFLLSLAACHLHLLGDLLGSRGPDGYQWPIPYFHPFFPGLMLSWSGQWELSGWQNSAIGVAAFVAALVLARYRGVTFFELVSLRFEAAVRETGRRRGFFKRLPEDEARLGSAGP
jgi:inner membrane protein